MPRRQKGSLVKVGKRWGVRYWKRFLNGGVVKRRRKWEPLGPAGREKTAPADIVTAQERFMIDVNAAVPCESSISFLDYFEQEYLPWVREQKKPSTSRGYAQAWKNWIRPVVAHDKPLASIRTVDVQSWMRVIEEGRVSKKLQNADGDRTLSKKSLLRTKSVLSGCFTHAIKKGFLEGRNPVEGVDITPKAPPPKRTYAYTAEEVVAILNVLPEPAACIFAVCALAGLRRGEAAGLQWSDWKDGKLHILRSVWAGRVGTTKTEVQAAVPVIAQLAQRLEFHRLREQARWGTLKPDSPMFTNNAGGRIDMNNVVNRDILPVITACKHCGNPRGSWHLLKRGHDYERRTDLPEWHGLHSARRSLGSVLHRLGVPDRDIQVILRHTSLQTTLTYYVKVNDADSKKAMKRYERNLKSLGHQGTLMEVSTVPAGRVN